MNSSPGGISGIFVHEKHFNRDLRNLHGWWSNRAETRFEMRFVMEEVTELYQITHVTIPFFLGSKWTKKKGLPHFVFLTRRNSY